MARFKLEEHEAQINQLIELTKIDGIDQGKVSLIIQGLRDNYTEVNTDITKFTNDLSTTKALNDSIVLANQTLLSKLGQVVTTKPETKPEQPKGDVKSLEDIASELMK